MRSIDTWRKTTPSFLTREFANALDPSFLDVGYWPTMWSGDEMKKMMNLNSDVSETSTSYQFKIDIPGLSKDQIKIELHNGNLVISGERREESKDDSKRYHLTELKYGSFMRSFVLPAPVNAEKIEARYENGVLNLNVPKETPSGARQISIK